MLFGVMATRGQQRQVPPRLCVQNLITKLKLRLKLGGRDARRRRKFNTTRNLTTVIVLELARDWINLVVHAHR